MSVTIVTALTIHILHVEKFLVAFLRVSQRAFRPKRFLFQLSLISAIQKVFSSCFTYLLISFWRQAPARTNKNPPDRGRFGTARIKLKPNPKIYRHREYQLQGDRARP